MSGPRVIVRNTGPRGAVGNTGNTGGITGPTTSVPGGIAVFADESGNSVNDSGVLVSTLATKASVMLKQDAEAGKGLSSNDYTNSDKAKLARLDGAYRGSFTRLVAIEAHNFSPAPAAGDYCLIEVEDSPVVLVLWDETNLSWVEFSRDSAQMSGQEIANVLFKESDAEGWTKELCRVFTHGDKATLELLSSQVSSIAGAITIPPFGSMDYFSVTGTTTPITAVSNGTTNLVKIDADTALDAGSTGFDSGDSPTNNRLRYSGSLTRSFHITAVVSVGGAPAGDVLVFGAKKTGALIDRSRVLSAVKSASEVDVVTLSFIASLAQNDYIELMVGNTTSTGDPTIHALSVTAVAL